MLEVVAVIPTFNSVDLISKRIEELRKSSFHKIVICDDKSEDNTITVLKEKYGDTIELIAGDKNLGPGGNRNRILNHELINTADFLFFLDADCQVTYTGDIAQLVSESFAMEEVGVVGFSLTDPTNKPMKWNYGDLMHPVHEAPDQKLDEMLEADVITQAQFIQWAPARAASYRLLPEEEMKEVGWIAEGCFAIRADLFKQIGGFAEQMRYHETHDFNARVREHDYKTFFNPVAVAQHLEHDSRMHRRESDIRSGRLYYYQQHWGMNEEVFSRLFDDQEPSSSSIS